jgi:tetratricopeptide (TPR) repeat protein
MHAPITPGDVLMDFEQWRHSARAWMLHFIGKDDLAFAEYVIAFNHAPSAKVARNLGFIATQKKRSSEGAYWFAEATKLDPGNAETWFNLGFALEHNGQRQEAVAAFRECVRLKPGLDRAWYGLGLNQAARGEHHEAAKAFEETVKLQPMHGDAWYQLGMAQHHAHNPDRVAEVIAKLKAFEPKLANQLIRDAGRTDLAHLHTEMPF